MNRSPAHPAPRHDKVGPVTLAVGLFGAPLAWAAQLAVCYALASRTCFPGSTPLAVPNWGAMRTALWSIDALAIVVAAVAAVVAWVSWRHMRDEKSGSAHAVLDAGEGRKRFLALCGIATSVGFLVALIFNIQAVILVPACAG